MGRSTVELGPGAVGAPEISVMAAKAGHEFATPQPS